MILGVILQRFGSERDIYRYIRIAFSIELRLRVSRSLRSLGNYIATEKYHMSVTGIALVPAVLALIPLSLHENDGKGSPG